MDNLPQLALSNEQQQIINAHAANAAQAIIGTKFVGETQQAVHNIIYQQGMLRAFHNLLVYDAEMLRKAQEQATNQEQQ